MQSYHCFRKQIKLHYFLLLLGVELGVDVGVDLVMCLLGASTVGVLGSDFGTLLTLVLAAFSSSFSFT